MNRAIEALRVRNATWRQNGLTKEAQFQARLDARTVGMPTWVRSLTNQGAGVNEGFTIIFSAVKRVLVGKRTLTNDPLDWYPMGIYSLGSDILHGKGEFAKKE
jgi:hypothetical protein